MDSLLHLNQVNAQVRGLRSRLGSAERYLAAQNRQLEDLNVTRKEVSSRQKHTKATMANFETEMAAIDERIEKLRNELNSAETNKQYTAVLTELNTVKVQRGEVEDQILKEMEMVDTLDTQLAERKEQISERKKVRDHAKNQLEERKSEVGERLDELETEREQAAAAVPGKDLEIFEQLVEIYDGEAMAELFEINRRHREYACGACNIHLPFELVSRLMGACDDLVRCATCSRILYMQDELRGSLAKK
ncbi:MAG: C4-type zinc ribbon domain-containing protein [Planctomycetota bacterium]|nr:C4-type zinc ribbon domain-containing protein [Planctomycetota bacterium]